MYRYHKKGLIIIQGNIRGIFLIVLASQSLENYLGSQVVGDDFIEFKKTQGFDVDVVSLDSEGINSNTGLRVICNHIKIIIQC